MQKICFSSSLRLEPVGEFRIVVGGGGDKIITANFHCCKSRFIFIYNWILFYFIFLENPTPAPSALIISDVQPLMKSEVAERHLKMSH